MEVKVIYGEKPRAFKEKVRFKVRKAGREAVEFVDRNKEVIVAAIPVGIAVIKMGQTHMVGRRAKLERERIDKTYYDPSTGFHWELRRKATNQDRAEILRRKALGQETYDILKSMKLIKK